MSEQAFDDIVITGAGMAAPLGLSVDEVWSGVRAGRCGIGPLTAMDARLPLGSDGGQAPDLPDDFYPDLPREVRYLRHAIDEAVAASQIDLNTCSPDRRAIVLGTTLHGMRSAGAFLRTGDFDQLKTFLAGDTLNLAGGHLDARAMSLTTCSACSSSLDSIALGVTLLQLGWADVVVAGGYDTLSEYVWGGFNALRLVSGPPLRPFVRGRAGMKLAEGYGIVVLERRESATRRDAPIFARIAGWAESADSFHLTRPQPEGIGAARAMRQAIDRAGITPARIGLIAAHATGTPDNDAAEAAAIASMFGESAKRTPVVGFKSYLGHTLGGAGAVELILAAKAMQASIAPPCCNVEASDVEFDSIRVHTGAPLQHKIDHTLNTSLGFGGANTCVVLGRAEAPSRQQTRTLRTVCITGLGVIAPGMRGIDALIARGDFLDFESADIRDELIDDLIDARKARRQSPYVKYMLAAARLALSNAQILDRTDLLENAGAFLGSTHGSPSYSLDYYRQIVREGVQAANPMLFAEGVPNAGAAHLSLAFGLRGGCRTIIGTTSAGIDAVRLAAARIASGDCALAVVGAAEESHEIIDRAYRSCDSTAPRSVSCAAALILEDEETVRAGNREPLARISVANTAAGLGDLIIDRHSGGTFSVGPILSFIRAVAQQRPPARIVAIDRSGNRSSIELVS